MCQESRESELKGGGSWSSSGRKLKFEGLKICKIRSTTCLYIHTEQCVSGIFHTQKSKWGHSARFQHQVWNCIAHFCAVSNVNSPVSASGAPAAVASRRVQLWLISGAPSIRTPSSMGRMSVQHPRLRPTCAISSQKFCSPLLALVVDGCRWEIIGTRSAQLAGTVQPWIVIFFFKNLQTTKNLLKSDYEVNLSEFALQIHTSIRHVSVCNVYLYLRSLVMFVLNISLSSLAYAIHSLVQIHSRSIMDTGRRFQKSHHFCGIRAEPTVTTSPSKRLEGLQSHAQKRWVPLVSWPHPKVFPCLWNSGNDLSEARHGNWFLLILPWIVSDN